MRFSASYQPLCHVLGGDALERAQVYRGLYGGLGMRDIRERKRLKPGQQVLDHMGSTELAANLFCATQTEEKLRRENVRSLKIVVANVSSL